MSSCKERWRNLRGCFTRHLKQQNVVGARFRKPYYLAEHLKFVFPFTKTRKRTERSHNNIEKPENVKQEISIQETACETIEDQNITYDSNDQWQTEEEISVENQITVQAGKEDIIIDTSSPVSNSTPLIVVSEENSRKRIYDPSHEYTNNVSKALHPYLNVKKTKPNPTYEQFTEHTIDADWFFLQSLLPDIRLMDQVQKRKLRINFLNIIDTILSENTHIMDM